MSRITERTAGNLQIRTNLDSLPSTSSPQRENLEQALNSGREELITLLEQRVSLLDDEIASLKARIGPAPASSPADPQLDELGWQFVQREAQRSDHQAQLGPLRRWRMRREVQSIDAQLAEIDQELSGLPPVSDPSNPRATQLTIRREELELRKQSLVHTLESSAVEYKQFDSRWGATRYGPSPDCTNIQAAGCGPTSLAIVLNYLYQEDPESLASTGQMEIVTPAETGTYAATHGRVCNSGTAGDTMVTQVSTGFPGFLGHRISLDQATTQLHEGNLVIFLCKSCKGTKRSGGAKSYVGHFMVLNGVNESGTSFNVLDPGAGETTDIETISRAELTNHTAGFWIVSRK
ncbi:MAG: C39 family peptidase [Gemmatimonadota bacterium]|nr:C39 family peptidase [Gemmatimonadota bacterium]